MPKRVATCTALLVLCLIACLPAPAQSQDLPPLGRSLFDHLTIDRHGVQRVPFPFTALIERVQREVGPDALGHAGVRSVLIPLGRSLQRNASVAEAYRYPRIVAAVVGEPKSAAPLLRDRLYLGYHEKAGLLEVISYNEAAGRFEFQVVKDYRAGGGARVFQSRRIVCLSCHQGAAPIFSRPGWDETNANPRVAAELARGGGRFHGVPAARSIDEPNAIDNAIARANRFETTQRIWREGCAPAQAIDCRAQALLGALTYRLAGEGPVDTGADAYRAKLLAPLRAAAQVQWPDGLPLADPSIPNRDPLAGFPPERTDFGDAAALLRAADVRPAFDPLEPRPPLARWQPASEAAVAGYVRGIAEFLAPADIGALERRLVQLRRSATRRTARAPCSVDRAKRGLTLRCASGQAERPPLAAEIRLSGAADGGSVDAISLAGASLTRPIALSAADRRPAPAQWTYRGLPLRLSDASVIERLSLRIGASGRDAELEVRLADDMPALVRAVDGLARQAREGASDALGDGPIRRGALLRGLSAQLGIVVPAACCDRPLRAAPPTLDLDAADAHDRLPAQLQVFVRHCAACHDTREDSPPGFLHGNADEVRRSLSHCAERIGYRLAMWSHEPAARPRVPMPPPTANGLAVAPPAAEDVAQMRAYVAQFVRVDGQRERPYEALAPCRPELPRLADERAAAADPGR